MTLLFFFPRDPCTHIAATDECGYWEWMGCSHDSYNKTS